ncbi:MAG: hypothetical protein LC776_03925 [Acidobacteria bacterium]|nr:hypothetical protein [Acidobacteriota bacterium]
MTEQPAEPPAGPEPEPLPPSTRPPRDLTTAERALAGFIGATGTGVGGVGIFLSDNQAGTAVISLLGVIFLVMAVQGTALRRLTKDGGDFADRALEQHTVNKVQEALEEQGPKAAQAALDAATAARPALERSPAVAVINGHLYEREAIDAVRAAWRNVIKRRATGSFTWTAMNEEPDLGVDAIFSVEGAEKPKIAVEVLYSHDTLLTPDRLGGRLRRMDRYGIPYLIVSSERASPRAWKMWKDLPRAVPRQFVHWRAGGDIEDIEIAIERLVDQDAQEIPMDSD